MTPAQAAAIRELAANPALYEALADLAAALADASDLLTRLAPADAQTADPLFSDLKALALAIETRQANRP